MKLVLRDLQLAWQSRGDLAVGLVFFLLVTCLFPLAVGPEPQILARIGGGVLWVSALLAHLLALPRLFEADWRDGTLEQLMLTPLPVSVLVLAKLLAFWISTSVPLALLSPVLATQYFLDADARWMLFYTLLLGTPVLSALGSLGAALTLGVRQGGFLLALLVLPLTAPVLIFACGAVGAVQSGLSAQSELSLLAALCCLSLAVTPWLTAMALKLAVESL